MSATFTTVSSEGEDSRQDASESASRTSAEPEDLLSRLKEADRSSVLVEREAWHSKAAYLWSIMVSLWSIMVYFVQHIIVSIKA